VNEVYWKIIAEDLKQCSTRAGGVLPSKSPMVRTNKTQIPAKSFFARPWNGSSEVRIFADGIEFFHGSPFIMPLTVAHRLCFNGRSMKRMLAVICGTTLLLSLAQRSPAQLVEKKPSPKDAPATSLSKRFEGTWRATTSWKIPVGSTFNQTQTLVIKNGVANYTRELTATLASGKQWNDLPPPYNSSSPIYTKRTNKSSNLKTEESNLRIYWQGQKLTDWTPKTIPISAFKDATGPPSTVLLVLSEDHLIVTTGQTSQTYTRVGQ
jgi:hypothetical protein